MGRCSPRRDLLVFAVWLGTVPASTARMEKNMGRGDKRSRKGKIFKGSYGNSRLQRAKKAVVAAPAKAAKKG